MTRPGDLPGHLPGDLLEQVLAEAFPFHLVLDGAGTAVRVGPSLRTACPGLVPGVAVADHLVVRSPRGTGWSFGRGAPAPTGLVLVAAASGPLVLRGQLLTLPAGVLLLGSPWVTTLSDLDRLGLRLDHFAAADPVTDFVMMLSAQASALADARHLARELEARAAEQAHQAAHDALTGLPNRAHFTTRLAAALQETRAGGSVAVVLLDLDRFKEVNDTLGHHCGDQLLTQVGPRIRETLREGELVARLGGDEFGLVLATPEEGEAATADVLRVVRRVLHAFDEPFLVDGVTLTLAATAGVAVAPEHGDTQAALLQHADVAMYVAKAAHEAVAVYRSSLDDHDPRKLRLLAQLRAGIDAGELVLDYQPLLDLGSGRVRGVEALVRWEHPQEGRLPPSEFVPLAESSGLVHPLTHEVLAQACEQARRWELAGRPLVVSVNVSARCLLDETLPDRVARELARTGLPARLLKLEVTESAIIADPRRAQAVLERLRALGTTLSIDDFGTGYTSLASLRDLPVGELKIDRSFVTAMLDEPRGAAIVRTGIELATRLGMASVAEGIEDAATLAALADLGCTTAQGYHVARPMPAAQLDAWLAARAPVHERRPLVAGGAA
ncbi:putative bifunctional diguanylate cyclase/phosphodiesterase [Kineococcus rubinsiae]|uniref:putative bifunctional diguanylate cyclase/phosphodiesterase n=1 Tax=Kineococcus rubinsiae TaxID=2609562 RepID=UPI0014307B73|nr:EAL domain-containing protein [Kineococcus rubinsiae]NIZ92257.1 EAL domain-containing protein [Kineococcus rubinsiae]